MQMELHHGLLSAPRARPPERSGESPGPASDGEGGPSVTGGAGGGPERGGAGRAGMPWAPRRLIVSIQAREHVRLAVTQADDGADLAIAEGGEPAEPGAGNALDRHFQLQRDIV